MREWINNRKRSRNKRIERERTSYVTCYTFYCWVRRATAGFLVLLIGVAANSYIDRNRATEGRTALVKSGRIVSVDGCNRDFRLYQTIRGVFERSLESATEQHDAGLTTDAAYQRSKRFYDQQLLRFTLPDCRRTEVLLTANPELAKQPVPRPLYEGSPEENIIVFDPKPNGG